MRRSETGRENLGDVQDGLGDPPEGPGRVGGPSVKSKTGLETIK